MNFLLDSVEKEKWLVQHIPHRVCAALAGCQSMSGNWTMPAPPSAHGDPFHIYCVCRAMDEGQKTGVRWLIDLLGIAGTDAGVPYFSAKKKTDVTMERFGASSFDIKNPDAITLAKVWKGCSQASSHATTDTNHFPVGDKELAAALTIIIAYLEAQLYAPAGKSLLQIVRGKS